MGGRKQGSHGKLKFNCAECVGCPHGTLKGNCAVCKSCPQGKRKDSCTVCNPCPHGKPEKECKECKGYLHGKLKRFCAASKKARPKSSKSPSQSKATSALTSKAGFEAFVLETDCEYKDFLSFRNNTKCVR